MATINGSIIVKWTLFAMVDAEELGVTQKNVDEMAKSDKPELKRVFGTDGNLGEQLGLTKDWVSRIVKAVGNYGEIVRSQRRRRLQARHRPRPQPALEQGRNSVRAADPLIAGQAAAAMSIEPRPPPSQFAAKLRRALGGRAGWSGFVVQIVFVAALVWIGYEIVANARANLAVAADHLRLRLPGEHGGL